MTDEEWKNKLEEAISGKTGEDLKIAKKSIFEQFANTFPDDYAWENGNRRKPTGPAVIASKIQQDMRRVFGKHYDSQIGYEAAQKSASMYY